MAPNSLQTNFNRHKNKTARNCHYCGAPNWTREHSKVCKAKTSICGKCGKKGHLDSLCRSSGTPVHMLEAQDCSHPQSQESRQDHNQSPETAQYSGDVFQERLDRVLRLVPGVLGIADDIVIHGAMENTHDGTVLILCETARLNNLSLNSKKMQFKSTDSKFFGHRLTPDGIEVDPKKIEAIIHMEPPQNVASLVFQWYGELPEEIQSSLIQTLRTPKKTMCVRSQMGMGV